MKREFCEREYWSVIKGGKLTKLKNDEKVLKYNQKWGFGMAPLKQKTEYKYKKATYTVLKILSRNQENEIDLDDISTFKGMVNRCIRQDQWDWFTVYTKFGEPDPTQMRPIPNFLTELRNAFKTSNKDKIEKILKRPQVLEVIELCEVYLNKREVKNYSIETGYIYILSRREEPKVLKIGMTNRNVEKRVKEINSATGVVFPLSARRVFKVTDARNAEKMIFKELEQYRIRNDREFFKIDYFIAEKIIREILKENNFLTVNK